ncbi:helix-turn-helix transcriptional regulator [Chryseobacterium sp. MFBS3-17]|uniref:helix-turn-helix transcriptional regulator n=1 Tax=Chryseobacterium sp. MFBS3-17 TaxID=2886689 RepID=UPI001D0E692E|nr:helix-turn-helix transcriptional regulator [Chryseobacterium sp. MFBS3-17]MCC2591631.1 helix-turn-helix transcriptional regulator [Chryseobacterium sp. MFBS3-17]
MNLNERIAKILEYSGYTASEFADAIEVQRSSVSHITSGRNKPSLDFLIKVKDRFPELQWDWLIKGEGEMLQSLISEEETEEESSQPKTTSLPDLFSIIEEDYLGGTESEDTITSDDFPMTDFAPAAESPVAIRSAAGSVLTHSQPSEPQEKPTPLSITDNQTGKVKRIVLFYEDGRFESFEP